MAVIFGTEPHPALFELVVEAKVDDVRALLDNGADVNETNVDDYTALHQAASIGDEGAEVATLLIQYGADTLAKNCLTQTPLHVVLDCMSYTLEVKQVISRLLGGVDQEIALRQLYAREDSDCTPEEFAISADDESQTERQAISHYLAARKADLEAVFVAVRSGRVADVQHCVSLACSVNRRDHVGRSLLVCAVEAGRLDMVRYLLGAGANRLVPNDAGDLPLHEAMRGGFADIGGLLVSCLGARGRGEELRRRQLAARNDAGLTPARLWTSGGGQPPDYLRVLVAPTRNVVSTTPNESPSDDAPPDYATAQKCRVVEPVKSQKEKSHELSWLHKH